MFHILGLKCILKPAKNLKCFQIAKTKLPYRKTASTNQKNSVIKVIEFESLLMLAVHDNALQRSRVLKVSWNLPNTFIYFKNANTMFPQLNKLDTSRKHLLFQLTNII